MHVEGQTEETFINEVIAPYLYDNGYSRVSARLLGNSRMRSRRGGITSWANVRQDVIRHLKEDNSAIATTMVDFYALPAGDGGWPGRDTQAGAIDQKALAIEEAVCEDLAVRMGDGFNSMRFVPYVAMHEFEGLLFSDCHALARALGQSDKAQVFLGIRGQFDSPEHINDSPITAPSKRVAEVCPSYQKTFHGPLAALECGIDVIRNECPGFNRWLDRLTALPQALAAGAG